MCTVEGEDICNAIETVLRNLKENGKISSSACIRQQQKEAIINIIQSKDTLALLPTGFGKSWIYMLLPLIVQELRKIGFCDIFPSQPVIPVIQPLNAIMQDQVQEARNLGLSAVILNEADSELVISGYYSIVFGSPEVWLENKHNRSLLLTKNFYMNCLVIVVDEVHKVSWGYKTSLESQPFREAFQRLGEFRCLSRQGVPVLGLTATADVDYQEIIKKTLNFTKDLKIVSTAVHKENIRLSFNKVKKLDFCCLNWIVDMLKENGAITPITIIYCKSYKIVGLLYEYLEKNLKEKGYSQKPYISENCLFGMYHSLTLKKNQTRVLESLLHDGTCRVIVATSALGMGINPQNVQYVVHYGPPQDLADYVQQIGRAGRNVSLKCHAILYFYGSRKWQSQSINEMVRISSTKCLRSYVYSKFDSTGTIVSSLKPGHLCCSYCHRSCDCCSNCPVKYDFESPPKIQSTIEIQDTRDVTQDQRNILKSKLKKYFQTNVSTLFTPGDAVSGITIDTISNLVENVEKICDIDSMMSSNHILRRKDAVNIMKIIENVLQNKDYDTETFIEFPEFTQYFEGECSNFVSETAEEYLTSDSE